MAITPRQAYEKWKNGDDVEMDAHHAKISKTILMKQAEWVAEENCVEKVSATDDEEPWVLTITFSEGELTEFTQNRLKAMRQNAHKTEMETKDGKVQIQFYVYTVE